MEERTTIVKKNGKNRNHVWQRPGHGNQLYHVAVRGLGHRTRSAELVLRDLFCVAVLISACHFHL